MHRKMTVCGCRLHRLDGPDFERLYPPATTPNRSSATWTTRSTSWLRPRHQCRDAAPVRHSMFAAMSSSLARTFASARRAPPNPAREGRVNDRATRTWPSRATVIREFTATSRNASTAACFAMRDRSDSRSAILRCSVGLVPDRWIIVHPTPYRPLRFPHPTSRLHLRAPGRELVDQPSSNGWISSTHVLWIPSPDNPSHPIVAPYFGA